MRRSFNRFIELRVEGLRRRRQVRERREALQQARGAQEPVGAGPAGDDAETAAALPGPVIGPAQHPQPRAVEEGDRPQVDQHVRGGPRGRRVRMRGRRARRRQVCLAGHLDHDERIAATTMNGSLR
jgi:hypothetical protein